MFLSPEEFAEYARQLTAGQIEAIQLVRGLILESGMELVERVDTGKWFGGLLVYNTPDGVFTYALGPLSAGATTFHMMAYYGSSKLQERHGATLKPLLSGKSCIKLKHVDQLPVEAIKDIIAAGPAYAQVARETFAARKKK